MLRMIKRISLISYLLCYSLFYAHFYTKHTLCICHISK